MEDVPRVEAEPGPDEQSVARAVQHESPIKVDKTAADARSPWRKGPWKAKTGKARTGNWQSGHPPGEVAGSVSL
ncbi:hypothetical protein GCM10009753_28370 [Streptantibioticus ferralitis]